MKKLIIILGVLGCSLSAILVKGATAPSVTMVFYRMLFSVIILLPFALINSRDGFKQTDKKSIILSCISGLFLGFHFMFYFQAVKCTSIAAAVVLVDTEVFFVILGSLIFLKEKISVRAWICVLTTFLGSVIIAVGDSGQGGNALIGDIYAIAGAFCVGVYTLIGKTLRKGNIYTNVYTTFVYISASIIVAFVIALMPDITYTGYGVNNILAGIGLAVFCTLLGHSVFSWGLKYVSAAFVSAAKLLEPVFASVMGIFVFNEIPDTYSIIGGIIIILGITYYCSISVEE